MQPYYEVPNLKNYDVRRLARKSLKGKWERAVLPMILIVIALTLPGLVNDWSLFRSGIMDIKTIEGMENFMEKMNESNGGMLSSFLSFFSFLCTGAISISAAAISIRVLRNEKIAIKNAFDGFSQLIQGFLVDLLTSLFSFLWALVTLVPGMTIFAASCQNSAFLVLGTAVFGISVILYVYIVMRYSMVFFVAQDNRTMPSLQVIRYSVLLMRGRTGRYFLLQLSFIGWIILSSIPMLAGMFFLMLASESASFSLKCIGIGLILIGFLTLSMVQLYINTADGVFYSAVSGNFGLAEEPSSSSEASAGQGSGSEERDERIPEAPADGSEKDSSPSAEDSGAHASDQK